MENRASGVIVVTNNRVEKAGYFQQHDIFHIRIDGAFICCTNLSFLVLSTWRVSFTSI